MGMWQVAAVVLLLGQLFTETDANCLLYGEAERPRPGSSPDSYIQNGQESLCPAGETFDATICNCILKTGTMPAQPSPSSNALVPTSQFLPLQPGQTPVVVPISLTPAQIAAIQQQQRQQQQLASGSTQAETQQQNQLRQLLRQQQQQLLQQQLLLQQLQQRQPAGSPNSLLAAGAISGNDVMTDMLMTRALMQSTQGAGLTPAAVAANPGLAVAALSGHPLATGAMTVSALQNPNIAPVAALYGVDQAAELAATQTLLSQSMRNPALGLMSTAVLDLPDTASLMLAAQGAGAANARSPAAAPAPRQSPRPSPQPARAPESGSLFTGINPLLLSALMTAF